MQSEEESPKEIVANHLQLDTKYDNQPSKHILLRTPFDSKTFLLHGEANDQSVISMIDPKVGLWEPHITKLLPSIIRRGSLCLDLGANIGAISLILSHLAPAGRVYAFEPGPSNYYFLTKNIRANNLNNIQPLKLAVSNRQEEIEYMDVENSGAHSYIQPKDKPAETHGSIKKISAVSLDFFVNQHNIRKIDFIKMDTEGYEIPAIQGALNSFKRWRPDLMIEFNPVCLRRYGYCDRHLFRLLNTLYKNIYFIYDHRFVNDMGRLIKLNNHEHLHRILPSIPHSSCDFYCTNHDRIPLKKLTTRRRRLPTPLQLTRRSRR